MAVKTVIDGTLLADCERLGTIRYGMLRVAEEITKRLINEQDLDLYFANVKQTVYNDNLLRKYLKGLSGKQERKTLSYPFGGCNLSILEKISAKFARKIFPGTILNLDSYNVFHSFYNPFPNGIKRSKITKSITLLDIIPLRLDGYANLIPEVELIVQSAVSNFSIAISNFSKFDLCNYEPRIDPEKVFVVPLAADKELFYPNSDMEKWQLIKNKYSLPENFFLSVSGIDKRKNLAHLIYSFNKLVLQENIGDLHLVLTGSFSFDNTLFKKLSIDKKTKSRIIFAKSIDDNDLHVVYSKALCFFFMSTYEGFGLPVLEAMQCGTPVICSNATSLPEVVGNAGIMLPPQDEDALCEAMLRIYLDSELRSDLSQLGLQRSTLFSWERCSNEYRDIFKKISS